MNPQNLSERELLEELVKTQRKSATFAKIAAIAACTFAALLLVAVVIIVPRFLQAADQVVQTANNVTKTIEQVNESVATLTTLSDESGNTLEKVDGLIDSASETLLPGYVLEQRRRTSFSSSEVCPSEKYRLSKRRNIFAPL